MNKLFGKFKQFLAISFDVFYKFDGKNIQNIIVIEKQMNPSENQLLCPMNKLQDFFRTLQPNKLIGFHSALPQKLKENYDSVTFDQIKGIFRRLHQKDIFKNKKNWKQDQVALFLYIVDKASLKFEIDFYDFTDQIWEQIAELIPGRSAQNCKTKMVSLVPTNLNETPWTEMEQQILAEIIEKQGTTKWKTVSTKLYDKNPNKIYRSSKQCRQRYMCFLKPDLKKGFWSDEQDYQLIMLFLQHGRKWSKMTQFINGRNENAIKNRFFLLFQQSSRSQKLYYSEFMRKVLRRKQKLQKILNKVKQQSLISKQTEDSHKKEDQNLQISLSKYESNSSSDREYKQSQLIQIQKFLTF